MLCVLQSVKLLMNDFDNIDSRFAGAVKPIYKSAHIFFIEGLSSLASADESV